jgi:hypothetical protein
MVSFFLFIFARKILLWFLFVIIFKGDNAVLILEFISSDVFLGLKNFEVE